MLDKFIEKLGQKTNHWAGGYEINKKYKNKYFVITFIIKTSTGVGRFGGGWNWKLGVQLGGNTLIVNLLICYLRIHLKRKRI